VPEVSTVQELAAQVASSNMNTLIWVVGALFSIVIGLIGYVWKGSSTSAAKQSETIAEMGKTLATHSSEIEAINRQCQNRLATTVTEERIRHIFREETQSLKETISDSIRLKLIEDGYLSATRTKN